MKASNIAVLFALVAVLCWSTVATAFKLALAGCSLLVVLWIAAFTSFVVFGTVALLQNKLGGLRYIGIRHWTMAAFIGLLNPVAYYWVLFEAYSLLPAQIAQPVNYSWPILLVVMLAIINRQPISKLKLLGLSVSLAGVVAISMGAGTSVGKGLPLAGLMVALLSALLWAVYWMVNSRYRKMDSILLFFLSFLFGSVYLSMLVLVAPGDACTWQGVWSSVYIGLFEMSIPFLFFGMATRKTKNPVLINQLCYLSPFLSLLIIHFVLGEDIRPTTYIGLGLIVLGLVFNTYMATVFRSKRKKQVATN